jgi:protocatechuate 3,4-dioxygenase beta subunit
MTDSTSTKLYFLAGLLAALVLVPVLALAATTSPAAVQDGATFNATSGPEVTAGEDMNVATNDVFPDSETVQLGPVNVSHGGQIEVNLTGADTSLPTIRPQASPPSDLRLAHNNTSLSASVTGGSIDSLSLSESATVGDSTRDIEIDTGGTGTTLTVSGLTTSQVTFIDSSGSQNQELATKSVSSGTASLSVGANAQRDILLATSPAAFDVSIDSTNSSIIEGQTLTVTATVTNTGGAQATQTVTLDAGTLGTNSTSVTLASGANTTVTLSLATSTGDDGTFTATVASDDDTASAQVTVLENVPNLQITSLSSNAPIDRGDTLSVDVTINNTGAKSDTQTVELSNGGTVRASASVTLSSGASTTETLTWDTSGDAVGTVSTVSTDNDTESPITTEDSWGLVNSNATGSNGPVAISPNGTFVAHGEGSDVVVYDTQTEATLQRITVASSTVLSLDWHPDGHRLAIGTDGNNLHVFNVASGSNLDTINYGGSVRAVEWSPDGSRLALAASDVFVLDADTRAQLQSQGSGRGISNGAIGWSASGDKWAVANRGGKVRVFDTGGAQIAQFNTALGDPAYHGVAFARNGGRLVVGAVGTSSAVGGTNTLALWDYSTQTELDATGGKGGNVVADPTDDRVAVSGSGGQTRVFAVTDTSLVLEQTLPSGQPSADVDWAHSGEYIAAATGGGVLRGDTWEVFASLPVVDGTVSDSNGNPVAGVTIELAQNGQRVDAMVTGGDGAFTLTAPESGTYNLTAVKTSGNQQVFETKTITVPDDGTTVPFTTTLINTGISGKVVDGQGDPVPNASVTTNQTAQSLPVNTQGRFVLDTRPGGFVVSADAPGYRSDTAVVSVIAGNVTAGVRLQLDELTGVPISGTVTDLNGNPIEDADVFVGPNATQTNLQGNYIAEVPGTGTFVVTAATAVDSKSRTVTVTDPNGKTGVDFVLARPSDPANASGNLEIRFENTGALVNNRTVTVGFFNDEEERFTERTTTTGLINLGTLNETGPIVAVGEAPGLFTRRIIINDLSGRSILFLLDDAKANSTVVVQDFDLQDDTGRFSGGDTRFVIKRAMPLPGETDDIPLRVLGADLLGANERFGIALETDVRYRITVKNDDGDVRDLGPHFAVSEGLVRIDIGEIEFNRRDEGTFSADAAVEDLSSGDGASELVTFNYKDAENLTSKVRVKIYNQTNESQVIHNQVHLPNGGAFGNLTVSELVNGSLVGSRWVVEYEITRRNETQSGVITVTSQPSQLRIPLSGQWQSILGIGMVVIIGGLFSTRNAAVGAIIVPAVAGTLWLIGILSGAVSGAAVALALTLGVAYNFATRGV